MAVPVPDMPLMLLMLFIAIPDGIDMTEPSDMVISTSIVAEVDMLVVVEVERASAATGPLAHSIVTAGRDGVATGTILAGDVMLDCARADDEMASTARIVCAEGYMLMQVVSRDWVSSAKRCISQF